MSSKVEVNLRAENNKLRRQLKRAITIIDALLASEKREEIWAATDEALAFIRKPWPC